MIALLQFPELDRSALTIPAFELLGAHLGPLHLRWYALGFLFGIVVGGWWMARLIKRDALWAPHQNRPTLPQVEAFLSWALLAVIVGGRIGYILFYMLPNADMRAHISADPLTLLRVWEGGLSFHGGFLGVVIAGLLFTRRNQISALTFGDLIAAVAPIGMFAVRIANFINGELYGRHSNVPWAMRFPEGGYNDATHRWIWLGSELPRHPSQLYEAALEGVALFVIINVATLRYKSLQRPGMNIGIFLVCYGVFRASLELVREPDLQMPDFLRGYVTMGMLLSIPMILIGLWLTRRAMQQANLAAA